MERKDKEMKAKMEEAKEQKKVGSDVSGTDVYADVAYRDPETGVEIPSDEAVEEAKQYVDEMNQM